jgi:hypothetical protein
VTGALQENQMLHEQVAQLVEENKLLRDISKWKAGISEGEV